MSEFQWFFIGLTITMLVFPWLIYLIGLYYRWVEKIIDKWP